MRILIGYNGSDHAKAALAELRVAGLPELADVLVFTVAETCLAPEDVNAAAEMAAHALEKLLIDFPNWSISAETSFGDPAREIVNRAESFRPDLIVVGEHKRHSNERDSFLGQLSRTILTEAECSVRMARGRGQEKLHPQKILIGFDGSPGSEFAVASVASRNWQIGTEVCLLAVADSSVLGSIGRFIPQMKDSVVEAKFVLQWAEALAADSIQKLKSAGLAASIDVRMGHPKDVIIEMAEAMNADCIFVGPHCSGNSFERSLLGGVTSAVATRAICSVEVVRQQPAL